MGCTKDGKACPVSGDRYHLGNDGFVRLPQELADKYGIKPDENYYVDVDQNTGNIKIVNEQWGALLDRHLATLNPVDGTLTENQDLRSWQGISARERYLLRDPEAIKFFKEQAIKVATKSLIKNGMDPDEAAAQATALITTTTTQTPTTTNAPTTTDPNIPIGRNNPFDEVVSPDTPLLGDSVPDAITPRKNFGKDHIYPLDLGSTDQDILKIDMVEYKAAGLDYKGTGRKQAGEGDRTIIGTVVLPIPSGIRDYNNVDWGSNSLNTMEIAAAKIAMATIEQGIGGLKGEVQRAIDHSQGTGATDSARDALKSLFTAAAIGKDFKNMIGRAEGAIMNPNMELLFNNPVLRPFEFTFLLAPRTSDESKAIARIIRFFKQGMAAKRTEGNLFLKSPNTFQLTYKHRGSKGSDHPYLNKFKECALKSCNINYTPNQSYSTYTDGAMTSYTMSLSFMELTPIYEDDYEEGATEESLNSGESFPAAIGF